VQHSSVISAGPHTVTGQQQRRRRRLGGCNSIDALRPTSPSCCPSVTH